MVKDNNYVEQLKGMLPQYLDILGVSTTGSILPKHSTTTWLVITANIVTQPQEHQLIMR